MSIYTYVASVSSDFTSDDVVHTCDGI